MKDLAGLEADVSRASSNLSAVLAHGGFGMQESGALIDSVVDAAALCAGGSTSDQAHGLVVAERELAKRVPGITVLGLLRELRYAVWALTRARDEETF